MTAPSPEDITQLSDADIQQLAEGLASAPATEAAATTSSRVASVLSKFVKAPTNTLDDLLGALDDLTVPAPLLNRLEPFFTGIGFALSRAQVKDPFDEKKSRPYTAAVGKDVEVVVLHLPKWVVPQSVQVFGILMQAIDNIKDRNGRIISEGLDRAPMAFRVGLNAVSKRETNSWIFVPWGDIKEVLAGDTTIEKAFVIPQSAMPPAMGAPAAGAPIVAPGPQAAVAPRPDKALNLEIPHDDQELIVTIFVTAADGDDNFFPALVQATDWPDKLRTKANAKWTGNAENDARQLLKFLLALNRYPVGGGRQGDTYLGWVLLHFLESLGDPAGQFIARIIVDYKLVNGIKELQAAKDRLPKDD